MSDIQYCNWAFCDLISKGKWLVKRDCSDEITLSRGDGRNWKAYAASLKPTQVEDAPPVNSTCPNCGKYVNGFNPYDDGETWRK